MSNNTYNEDEQVNEPYVFIDIPCPEREYTRSGNNFHPSWCESCNGKGFNTKKLALSSVLFRKVLPAEFVD